MLLKYFLFRLFPFSLFTYIRSLNSFLFSLSLPGFFHAFFPKDTGQTIQGTYSSSWCHVTTLPFSITSTHKPRVYTSASSLS